MDVELSQVLIVGFAVLSFITVLYNALKSRRRKMPPSAKNDVKARRLWQSDPQAYERKFGKIDRQLEQNAQRSDNS